MRTFISIVTFIILTSCNNPDIQSIKGGQTETLTKGTTKTSIENAIAVSIDTTILPNPALTNLAVLVLPPFDAIANQGVSPDIQKYIENIFTTDTTFRLIKFPYKQLMNVSFYNVFDKKYCSPITDKIKTDIIIMSKLDQVKATGNMTTDLWDFRIKIYNTRTGIQKLSNLNANSLRSAEIEILIKSKHKELFSEIQNNR